MDNELKAEVIYACIEESKKKCFHRRHRTWIQMAFLRGAEWMEQRLTNPLQPMPSSDKDDGCDCEVDQMENGDPDDDY